MPSQVEKFLAGRPKGVSRVVKDGSGRLQSWMENGYAFVVSRDGSGQPLQVLGTSLRGTINSTFTYDGNGTLTGRGGDVIPSVFAEDLLRDAHQLASSGAGGGAGGGGSTTVNNTLTSTSTTSALSAAQGKVLQDTKQANLVSGTNVKTINGTSILGSGDIAISGGGGGASVPVLRAIDTAGRTLAAADLQNLVRYNSASNANFTIPTDATLGITDANSNVSIEFYQMGTGRLDIVADTANGVTLNKWVGYPTSTQFVSQTIHRVGPNTWAVK